MEQDPTYHYVKGVGWIPSVKPAPPTDWAEQCARVCPECKESWGDHVGWTCWKSKTEWPVEDRWTLVERPWDQ